MKQVSTLTIPNNGSVEDLFMDYRNRLWTIGYDCRGTPKLIVWQMNDEGQFTLMRQESLKISGGLNSCEMEDQYVRIKSCKFDDQYVAIKLSDWYDQKIFFYFFSLNTMEIVSSLSDIPTEDSYIYFYGSGLLFNVRSGHIR
jgi:hypothetical protein